MMGKFIINFTPTGMIPTKKMTPHVPVAPGEIVAQVCEAAALGASMIHLHARDPVTGEPTYKKDVFAEMIRGIRLQRPDLVLCVSTSGRTFHAFEERSACLDLDGDLKPELGSLTLSSLNFNQVASVNAPDMIQSLARKMRDRGIRPELEAFDVGMINYANYLIRKELLAPPFYFNLILGNIACAQADMFHLGIMIRELPPGSIWSVGGVGDCQLKVNVWGILGGGGVRIGLEDNIWFDTERTRLATNRDLLERVTRIADSLGYRPYTCQEVRALLGV